MDNEEAGAGHARQGPPAGNGDSIQASVERLIASGKDLAQAEIAWAKLKGHSIFAILRRALLFTLLATVGLMVGLSLLLVAAVIALAPYTGLLNATLIVIAVAFLLVALFGFLARRAFHELTAGDEP